MMIGESLQLASAILFLVVFALLWMLPLAPLDILLELMCFAASGALGFLRKSRLSKPLPGLLRIVQLGAVRYSVVF